MRNTGIRRHAAPNRLKVQGCRKAHSQDVRVCCERIDDNHNANVSNRWSGTVFSRLLGIRLCMYLVRRKLWKGAPAYGVHGHIAASHMYQLVRERGYALTYITIPVAVTSMIRPPNYSSYFPKNGGAVDMFLLGRTEGPSWSAGHIRGRWKTPTPILCLATVNDSKHASGDSGRAPLYNPM